MLLREAGQERELRRYAFVDGVFSDPRPMVEGGLFGLALDAERALVLARSGEAFEWQLYSLETGAARTVDPSAHVGDGTGFGAFARIPRDRIVYVGQSATGAVLRVADLSGNAEPRDLLAETFLEGIVVAAVP